MATNKARKGKRPLIFSRYGGPGAGRYNIGFSGDTHSTWESLAYQPYFTATASNILFGYWSHDIGGFKPGPIEPELYTRWMQFGLYSPILRTHTTKNPEAERRVWEYPAPYNQIMMDVLRKRYSMVPYIYTEARSTFETGMSLCRPMYYSHPEEPNAYKAKDQYMFGSQILVAPVISKRESNTDLASVNVWLPDGEWYDTARGCTEAGGGWITRKYLMDEVPVFVRPGTMIPEQQNVRRLNAPSIEDLNITIYPGKSGEYVLYEDDGISTEYEKNNHCVHIKMHHKTQQGKKTITIEPITEYYKGFAATKTVEFHLPSALPPKAVRLGRKVLNWSYRAKDNAWCYDPDEAAVCIQLGTVDLRKGLSLTLEEDKGKPVNGLRGILSRLEQIRILNILVRSWDPLHPDERIGTEMAQMGNRIARNPAQLQSEWFALLKRFPAAMDVFKTIRKAKVKGNISDARIQNCDKALALINDLVKSGILPKTD
jgi:alpha-glucosidase